MLKSRGILFDIENLSIDGSTFSKEDNLNQHLEVGENLFAYGIKRIKGSSLAHQHFEKLIY